ncbi:MotE family protein [Halalkalibacterium halodurans]|uniref:MotE family protein n=1 Tax=Halalkalibacterium halodurans TaxID=86665 RepID=UPI0006A96883|nr:MotE family protein [Halalkalibacterium halodurans]MED3646170.1 MotE family protein [Halalkalibacterium halodurans]MED4081550.1 MotE family protein [Halalkalibacterium halodurans]MED4086166.1 MotE family protein [Halalkalibacterium halodurans]MED4106192.1 MotE family protein [Halalkalibacterium halodurans]MED4108605.1 MotE family protein [Halalkalibacterium halodurans]
MGKKEKGTSKFQFILFLIVIPIIFAGLLFSGIAYLLGYNVVKEAKEIGANLPVVGNYIQTAEEEEREELIAELEEQLASQQAELDRLERELRETTEELKQAEDEKALLEQREEVEEGVAEQTNNRVKELAKTYESMSPKNAAAILEEVDIEEAVIHMSLLSTDSRAAILGKMDPEKAATIMTRLNDPQS